MRIQQAGGFVSFNGVWRVAGVLATSRALGDLPLKEKNFLIADPDILTFDLQELEPRFMILATDGLWDYFSNEEAVEFVLDRLSEPHFGAKSLVLQAYYRGSLDNITVMVVDLQSMRASQYEKRSRWCVGVGGHEADVICLHIHYVCFNVYILVRVNVIISLRKIISEYIQPWIFITCIIKYIYVSQRPPLYELCCFYFRFFLCVLCLLQVKYLRMLFSDQYNAWKGTPFFLFHTYLQTQQDCDLILLTFQLHPSKYSVE